MLLGKDVDRLFFYVVVGFALVSLPLKYFLLVFSDQWFDYSNLHAVHALKNANEVDLVLLFILNVFFCLAICLPVWFSLKALPLCYRVSSKVTFSFVTFFSVFIAGVVSMFLAKTFNLFYVGIEAESLPFKLYGQLKILALCLPVFSVYYLYASGYKVVSLLFLLVVCIFNVSISGSKFSLLAPILLFVFLTNEKKVLSVGFVLIVCLYTVFNPYSFRGYIVNHADTFNVLDMFVYVLEDSLSLGRVVQSFVILVDRFPGADVVINYYFYSGGVLNEFNVNDWYNVEVLRAGMMKGSFATSMAGYFYMLTDLWVVFFLPLFLVFVFFVRWILGLHLSGSYVHSFNCVFFVFFVAMLLDGNMHLSYTYTSLYYFALVLLLVQGVGFLLRGWVRCNEK